MHYDFIEIGTSCFDTVIANCADSAVGLSIEPIKKYLDILPEKSKVTKINAAVSNYIGTTTISYIDKSLIHKYNLPDWLIGCSSINKLHPIIDRKLTWANNLIDPLIDKYNIELSSLITNEIVKVINFEFLIKEYNIESIDYLKIDTEGHDLIILHDYLDAVVNKYPNLYANKIQIETNELTSIQDQQAAINRMLENNYIVSKQGYETEFIRKTPNSFSNNYMSSITKANNFNKAIFFTIKINDINDSQYYCMLLYALETLINNSKNRDFDIIVYYDFSGKNIDEMSINGYSLTDFSEVKFIHKPWNESKNYNSIPKIDYFYKWLCIEHIVHNSQYEQIAYMDCDVIFQEDFNQTFQAHSEDFWYGLFEAPEELKFKLTGIDMCMPSGQFVFKRKLLLDKDLFFEKVLQKSDFYCSIAPKVLENHPSVPYILSLMEQYAGHSVLRDYNIPIKSLDPGHVSFGPGTCDIAMVDNEPQIIDVRTRIIHYTGVNSPLFVPKKYRNEKLSRQLELIVKNNQLLRKVW